MLLVAAAAQALEAVGLCVAAIYQVIEAVSGHSYQESSGVALAVLEVLTAALMLSIASAIARLRPWGRTPGVMTQICVLLLAVILIQSHQYAWGLPALVLALAGLVGLLNPASLRALRRPLPPSEEPKQATPQPKAAGKPTPTKPKKPATSAKKAASTASKRK
jgi:hypothetical protein